MQIRNSAEKNNKYMVGFDLGDRDSQISFCSLNQPEAETVPAVAGTKRYNIPTVLCKRTGVNQWLFGREALRIGEAKEGSLVENLFSGAITEKKTVIEEVEYDALTLLTLFVKKCFGLFTTVAPLDKIEVLMFTAAKSDERVIEVMKQVVDTLGFTAVKVLFQNHEESYYYYLLHQPPEFRMSGSVILDFEETLKVYLLEWNKRTTPVVSFAVEKEFPECRQPFWSEDEAEKEGQMRALDQRFLDIAVEIFQNRMIGSVFLVGSGFQEDWADRSLQYICRGRRVFKGNNLYSKGAAFGAYEKFCPTKEGKEHIFLGQEKLKTNIGLQVVREGKESYLALLDAGINWYEAVCEKEFYLETGDSFQMTLTPLTNVFPEKEAAGKYPVRYEKIELSGLPERPEGVTRLHIALRMCDAGTLHIKTEDLGFGEIYPASGLVWERDIPLQ